MTDPLPPGERTSGGAEHRRMAAALRAQRAVTPQGLADAAGVRVADARLWLASQLEVGDVAIAVDSDNPDRRAYRLPARHPEETGMTLQGKSLDRPDEARSFPNGEMALVEVAGVMVGRGVLQPGWRWSKDVKPIAGTESCAIPHTGYILSGRVHVVMDDGAEAEYAAGDVFVIAPGHDGWVVGDEPYVAIEWSGSAPEFAKPD